MAKARAPLRLSFPCHLSLLLLLPLLLNFNFLPTITSQECPYPCYPPPTATSNSPPTSYAPPPPAGGYHYPPPSSSGGGGSSTPYLTPPDYGTAYAPPPPNAILPYFPYYFRKPPRNPDASSGIALQRSTVMISIANFFVLVIYILAFRL